MEDLTEAVRYLAEIQYAIEMGTKAEPPPWWQDDVEPDWSILFNSQKEEDFYVQTPNRNHYEFENGVHKLRLDYDDILRKPSRGARTEILPIIQEDRWFPAEYGTRYMYSFKQNLANWNKNDTKYKEILAQWHGQPDKDRDGDLLEPYRNPMLSIATIGEDMFIRLRLGGTDKIHEKKTQPYVDLWSGSYETEVWTRWICTITWGWKPEQGPWIFIMRDDDVLVNQSVESNAYNDDRGPYFKCGIYKPSWTGTEIGHGVMSRRMNIKDIKVEKHGN